MLYSIQLIVTNLYTYIYIYIYIYILPLETIYLVQYRRAYTV